VIIATHPNVVVPKVFGEKSLRCLKEDGLEITTLSG
jgi:hypothetical protein